jgi:putative colanic acid biosynthesis glycosyltransferase WcaI
MPKVMFLTPAYYPEPVGSAPVVTDMAEWLVANGWDVNISTLRPSYPENIVFEGFREGELDEQNINGVRVSRKFSPPPAGGGIWRRLQFELIAFLQMLRISFRRENADTTHIVSICPSILVVLGAWIFSGKSRRHVTVVHDIQSGLARSLRFSSVPLIPKLVQWAERIVLNRADHIVVLTEEMEAKLKEIGIKKPMMILPPHVDERVLFPLDRPENPVPTLLYSGNLGRKQGLDQLVDLARVLDRRGSKVKIIVRGTGNHAQELKDLAVSAGLTSMTFEDFVPKERLNQSMSAADIHLVPQLPEGADFAVPSKIFAIMSSGGAFICTAHCDSPLGRLAQRTDAFVLTPPNDAEAFADTVQDLLQDRQKLENLGRRGRQYIEENLTRDMVMERFTALLTESDLVDKF